VAPGIAAAWAGADPAGSGDTTARTSARQRGVVVLFARRTMWSGQNVFQIGCSSIANRYRASLIVEAPLYLLFPVFKKHWCFAYFNGCGNAILSNILDVPS
jgi:hypothetical protein